MRYEAICTCGYGKDPSVGEWVVVHWNRDGIGDIIYRCADRKSARMLASIYNLEK